MVFHCILLQGLGKKRHPDRSSTFDPDFMAWTPNRHRHNTGRPLTSTYRQDFRLEEQNIQKIVKRPKTSFDLNLTTTYRTSHGPDSPNKDMINAMNNEALMLTSVSRQRQAKMRPSDRRETVASCMSWYRPRVVPAATATSDFNHIDMRPTGATDLNLMECSNNNSAPVSAPVLAVPVPPSAPAPVAAASE